MKRPDSLQYNSKKNKNPTLLTFFIPHLCLWLRFTHSATRVAVLKPHADLGPDQHRDEVMLKLQSKRLVTDYSNMENGPVSYA